MAGVIHIQWYATVFRKERFAETGGGRGAARDALRRDASTRSTDPATIATRSSR